MAAGPVAGAVNTRESVATQSLLSSSQGNSRSMALHVIEVIAKLRDHRPTANSSFASLGLDSLGSIMFIRALSVSLDGLSISPATLYAPGITIRSFARELTDRLRVENPALLRKITGEEVNINIFFNELFAKLLINEIFIELGPRLSLFWGG